MVRAPTGHQAQELHELRLRDALVAVGVDARKESPEVAAAQLHAGAMCVVFGLGAPDIRAVPLLLACALAARAYGRTAYPGPVPLRLVRRETVSRRVR